ncbi:MAG: alanine racemase, partial [Rhodoluna sp.]
TTDENRGGIHPGQLIEFAESVLDAPQIKLLGVMGVASLDSSAESDFERIAKASQALVSISPESRFISAGMSGDFETAIAFGATHIRVGTAITGKRE